VQREFDGCSDCIYPAGTYILSISPADDAAIEFARGFVKDQGYTSDQVNIVKSDNTISVKSKMEISL